MSANMMAEGAPPASVDSMREAMRIGGCLLANLPKDQLTILHSVLVEKYAKSADLTPDAEVTSEPKSNNPATARSEKPERGPMKSETVIENKPQLQSITTELPIAERFFAKDDEPVQPLDEIPQPKPPVVVPKKQPLEQLSVTVPREALVMARIAPPDVEKPVPVDSFSSERAVPVEPVSAVLTGSAERPVSSEAQFDEPEEPEVRAEEPQPPSDEGMAVAIDMPAEPENIAETTVAEEVEATRPPFEAAQVVPEEVTFEIEDLVWEARQEIGFDEPAEPLMEPEAADIMTQSLVATEPFEKPAEPAKATEIAPVEPGLILETAVENAILEVFETVEVIAETTLPASFNSSESPEPLQKEFAELSDEELEIYCEAVLVSRNLPADAETVTRIVAHVKEQLAVLVEAATAEEPLADDGTHERKQDATLGQIVSDDITDALRHVRFGRWLLQTAFSWQPAHQAAA